MDTNNPRKLEILLTPPELQRQALVQAAKSLETSDGAGFLVQAKLYAELADRIEHLEQGLARETPLSVAFEAMTFARLVHAAQRRKYTHNPYADHLAEVAGIVATVSHGHPDPLVTAAVAWLHDCVEDQGVSPQDLEDRFGVDVRSGVLLLSDLEVGNRAERKAAGRVRLAAAPGWVQDIKVADLISNSSSIVMHDPKFAPVYLNEKRLLLEVMTKANPGLVAIANAQQFSNRP